MTYSNKLEKYIGTAMTKQLSSTFSTIKMAEPLLSRNKCKIRNKFIIPNSVKQVWSRRMDSLPPHSHMMAEDNEVRKEGSAAFVRQRLVVSRERSVWEGNVNIRA